MKFGKFAKAVIIAILSTSLAGLVGLSPANAAGPVAVNLGSSASFAVLASGYATTGAPSTFNGNVGAGTAITTGASNAIIGSMYSGAAITVGAASSITGNLYAGAAITLGAGSSVSGSQYLSAAPQYADATNLYTSAMSSMNAAITDINSRTATAFSGTLGGLTLTPGVYSSVASLGLTGVLTLDAQGDSNAVFIIRSDSFLVTAAASAVVLTNGAQAKNVFWAPTGYFTAGADSIFKGNVLASAYISIGARTAIEGRLFSNSSYVLFGIGNPLSVFGITGIGTTDIATSGTIPSVLGLTQSAATTSLTSAGFTLGTVTTTAIGATAANNGQVATQSATGANQLFATAVNLVLYAYVAPTSGTISSVLGLTQSAATTSLTSAGFTLGTVTTTAIGATAANNGQVATQSATGANQLFATPVNLVLYAYVAPTSGTISSVLGLTQSAATTSLTSAGFTLGTVTTTAIGATAANNGQVATQSATGANQLFATAVDLVLYAYVAPTSGTISSVLGLTQGAATTSLTSAGFTLGTITTTAIGATAANNGQVATQSATGANQLFATAVDLVLYAYVAPTSGTISSVLGLTQSAATTSLTSAGFTLGTITTTAIGATAANNGKVASQSATGINQLFATAVDLVLYAYVAPTSGTISSVLGLTQSAATTSLTNAGFTLGTVTTTAIGATAANNGQVASQSATGINQLFATAVDLVLYAYVAPTSGTISSVLGLTQSAATTSLTNAGFTLGTVTTTAIGATAANNGQVASQSATGINQLFATAVDLVLYAYVAPPTAGTISSVLGLTQSAATTSLTSAGFTLGTVTTTAIGATAANNGKVATQSATGANQLFATAVDLVLYAYVAPPTAGTISSVLGLTQSAATTSLTSAGFTLGTITTTAIGATAANNGQVATQSAIGINQLFATAVDLVLYAYVAPTSGTISSVLGLTQVAATTSLTSAGFTLGTITTTAIGATAANNGQVATQSATGANQLFATAVDLVLYAYVAPTISYKSLKVTINFKSGSSKLSATEQIKLQRLLAKFGPKIISGTIVGYVQSSNKSNNDARLSTARARVIAKYLADQGVKVPLLTQGKGALNASIKARAAMLTIRYKQ